MNINNMQKEQTSELEFLENLAFDLFKKEDFENSKLCYIRQIENDPENGKAFYNLGIVLHDLGQFHESLMCYGKAKELGYNSAKVNLTTGMHFLKQGDFEKGFDYIDLKSDGAWRLGKNFMFNNQRLSHIDLWEGQSLENKTIFVYSEQGFGDNIQFSRYLLELSKLGGKVVFSCYNALYDIFVNSPIFSSIEIQRNNIQPSSDVDFKIPLMSVPRLLKSTFSEIPFSGGYLERTQFKDWGIPTDTINVAIAWEATKQDTRRTIPLDLVETICDCPNINFINIQKDSTHTIDGVRNLGDGIHNFSDTVDILSQVDLLVSTDTAMVHVAGALGVPVYLLLHYSADWRWFTGDMDYSPWYESVSIFRQKTSQNWIYPINQAKNNLQILLNQ